MMKYQQHLYEWHCQNIYPFDKRLSETEQQYVHNCISLSWWEGLRPFFILWDEMVPRLSFFNYSQKVDGDKVNKSRISYGSTVRPDAAYVYAKPVLEERGVELPIPPTGTFAFGGLGWDIEENQFKVYYRFHDFSKMPKKYQLLAKVKKNTDYAPQGILSWTFDDQGNISETKVYRYPTNELEAHLFSEKRKDIQVDCKKDSSWKDKINEKGLEILGKYGDSNHFLDTISIKDKDHFTLYFPLVF
jgi:hypothetical protein